jgi:hypothetical protein
MELETIVSKQKEILSFLQFNAFEVLTVRVVSFVQLTSLQC